ncbi:MAG TPA: DUF4215 domain-containing protein [Kofleriaceae bacterium]|nr:DUF4215 domain-containing protein [Kofleriaceae bacterium]
MSLRSSSAARWKYLWIAVWLTGGAGTARAQARDGDILIPEFQDVPAGLVGSVVNIRGGGDFTGAPRFATGLGNPMSVCQGPNGRIYASESGTGEVTDITAGGDFTGVAAFATGLSGPGSLLCSPTQMLVAELNSGQITDITAGGNFGGAPEFARIDRNPSDLLRDGDRLWLTSFNDGIIEITGGGDFRGDPYFAPNDLADDSSITIAQMGAQLLVGNEHTDQVVDFTAGGPLSGRPVFAQVRGVIGLRFIAQTGQLLAASELDDAIYDITAGGDFRTGATPFATGLVPEDVAQLVYVQRGCGNGDVGPGEECDDGNGSSTDACPNTCLDATCGDGFVRAGVEECDDANESDTDACPGTCLAAACGDGFVEEGVEECDDGNVDPDDGCDATCVVEPGTDPTDPDPTDPDPTDPDPTNPDPTNPTPAPDGGGGGCSATGRFAAGNGLAPVLVVGGLWFAVSVKRRRRRRVQS